MKIHFYWLGILTVFFLTACNKGEGLGGSSSVEGYVYNVIHNDDNFSFKGDTFPALGKKVYINFGDEDNVGDDTDAGLDGYYRFDYLREGNYKVYALSEDANGEKTAEIQKINVSSGLNRANTIYIHSGKASNTAMIKGKLWVKYYNKGNLVRINGQDSIPAVETRVYIKNVGDEMQFNDARASDTGIFVFQKLQPHKQYEVYANTERIGEIYKNVLTPIGRTVEVRDAYKVYPSESEEPLEFTIIINN
ncbi:hypothetical protein AGMMS50262_15360 [Bacteroidia bacterium]|nr:hypothetical protein AGMMS50262_15360 [Bacteroidia bacterium]